MPRVFMPAAEWLPDGGDFGSQKIVSLSNLVPTVTKQYVPVGLWRQRATATIDSQPTGLHVHSSGGGYKVYVGNTTKLYEFSNTTAASWTKTDKSRAVGGAYAASPTSSGWQGTSFGDAVIMTNFVDDVQLLTPSSAANFVKMAQSGGANPGMDPKAKFAFPVRDNMVLANLSLSAGFDGLASGANPTVVAWSQSGNCRQFGSANVTPQLVGAGYQPLNYDFGDITGGIGGQYGLIALQRGWVRMDGPPYAFRPISIGIGCQHPNSIVDVEGDVYFWGSSGPMVLRGGEGPAVPLARGFLRYLMESDNTYGQPIVAATTGRDISAAPDLLNRQVWFAYPTSINGFNSVNGHSILVYDIDGDRWGAGADSEADHTGAGGGLGVVPIFYMRAAPQPVELKSWVCGRDIVSARMQSSDLTAWAPSTPDATAAAVGESHIVIIRYSFTRLNDDLTTRVLRVRPVYRITTGSVPEVVAATFYRDAPNDAAVESNTSTVDSSGWLTFTDTKFAAFHAFYFRFKANSLSNIDQFIGFELDYSEGAMYSK